MADRYCLDRNTAGDDRVVGQAIPAASEEMMPAGNIVQRGIRYSPVLDLHLASPRLSCPSYHEDNVVFVNNGFTQEIIMGRALLLWLLGVPISVIILLALFWH